MSRHRGTAVEPGRVGGAEGGVWPRLPWGCGGRNARRVTSPRRTRARSYSAQFPTRYFVVYFGCTLDFTSRS